MVDTVLSIINNALQGIGARQTVASLSEGSPEARVANLCYDSTRRKILRSAPWNCARKIETLSLLIAAPGTPENPNATPSDTWNSDDYPPPPWLYGYSYPNDCVFVRAVCSQPSPQAQGAVPIFSTNVTRYPAYPLLPAKFEVGTLLNSGNRVKGIMSNISQAIIIYNYDVTDVSLWDPGLVDCMQNALSAQFLVPLTGKMDKVPLFYQAANQSIIEARAADGNEDLAIYDTMPDWIMARNSSVSYDSVNNVSLVPWGPMFNVPTVS